MIASTLISLVGLAQIPINDLPTVGQVVIPVATCPTCGVRLSAVAAMIDRLRSSPRRDDREEAAQALREIRPRCHPEVVDALSASLVRDPAPSVRREAAESLTRLGVARPGSHAALAFAASRDPNPFVRHQAVKGLKARQGRCPTDCPLCGPTALPVRDAIVIEERATPSIISKPSVPLTDAIPPPRPTPPPFGSTRAVPTPPEPRVIVSTPTTADSTVRRSSAKPVEGPTQVMPPIVVPSRPTASKPAPTSKPATATDAPPLLEGPAG